MPRRTKYHYVQDWGTYSNETPVFVGYTGKEISKIIKRAKWKEEGKEMWDEEEHSKLIADGCALTLKEKGYTMLVLQKYEDTWNFWETLMHECFHLVICNLGEHRAFINTSTDTIEDEGMAYQQEYLFRNIRRNLQKAFDKPKKKK